MSNSYAHPKNHFRPLLLSCVLFLIAFNSYSQKYLFKSYNTDDGLIQSTINDISQDNNGNIWVSTNAGISVFDGKHFKNFDDKNQLSNLLVRRTRCDKNGIIWIATTDGLLRYDGNFKIVFKPSQSMLNNITQLSVDHHNNKYFIFEREAYIISGHNDSISKLQLPKEMNKDLTAITLDIMGNKWIANRSGGIFKISGERITPLELCKAMRDKDPHANPTVFNIIIDSDINPYFITSWGMLYSDNNLLRPIGDKVQGLPLTRADMCVLPLPGNGLWMGTNWGAFKWEPGTPAKAFAKTNGLSDYAISCLFKDNENNMWFGSSGNGLYKLSTEAISLYEGTPELGLTNVNLISKTKNNEILFATYGEGLIKMKGNDFSRCVLPASFLWSMNISGLSTVNGTSYVGTFGGGMFSYNTATGVIKKSDLLPDKNINAIYGFPGGFLVYTNSRNMYTFDDNHKLLARKEMIYAQCVFNYDDSSIIIMMDNKADLYDHRLNLVRKNILSDFSSRMTCIDFYDQYTFVGGIGEGIQVYDKKFHLVKKLRTHSNIIYSLKVMDGFLYYGTNTGFSRIPLNGIAGNSQQDETVLFKAECKEEGILALGTDSMLVTTTKGIFFINKTKAAFNKIAPVISFDSIRFTNNASETFKTFAPNEIRRYANNFLEVRSKNNDLSIQLTGTTQSAPDDLLYQFILENYESKWNTTPSGDRIRYTNLKSGNYVFKARAISRDISSATIQFSFIVKPPLQAEWWFKALICVVLIALAAVLLGAFNMLHKRFISTQMIQTSSEQLEAKKNRIAGKVMDTSKQLSLLKKRLPDANNGTAHPDISYRSYLKFYLNSTVRQLELLWKQDEISIEELNSILTEITEHDLNKTIHVSSDISSVNVKLPVDKAEKIIRLFADFIFFIHHTTKHSGISINSKLRFGNQLFMKIYCTESLSKNDNELLTNHLQESISMLQSPDFSVELVESQNLGKMILLTLLLETRSILQ